MQGSLAASCNVECGFQDLKMKIQMLNEQAPLQLCDGQRLVLKSIGNQAVRNETAFAQLADARAPVKM